MSKESKETIISVNLEYNGRVMTLTKTVSDYELEERVALLAKQVKLLESTGGGLADPE